jgi:hypothetical protein
MVIGGAEGDRTPDLIIANDTLSQLSYCPNDRGRFHTNRARVVKLRGGRSGRGVLAGEGNDICGGAGPGKAGNLASAPI